MADLRHLLAIYVHAHQTGNSVPPHIDAEARTALAAEPPAPAPALPLDLDALLSPEGAYEPGTGQEDGAQLVDLCWWAPVHGCDTLENLLDRIRRRILPHLRPPIAGIDVPGTDGDYGGLQELCDAEGIDVRIGAPLLKRAREAWGAAQPLAPVPTIDDIWELCEDHEFHLGIDGANEEESAEGLLKIINTALGRWGRPAPAPAADGKREELAQWLYCLADERSRNRRRGIRPHPSALRRAAALLRQPAPALVPVPVAERPWERPGWCDAEGRCWWGRCADDFFSPEWTMATLASIEEFCSDAMPQHCLPHWAIAIPQPPQATTTTHPTPTEPPTDD